MSKPIIPMHSPVLQRAAVTLWSCVALDRFRPSITVYSGCRGRAIPGPAMLRCVAAFLRRVGAMSDVTITVRGEHETRVAPERGIVHASVRAEGADRGAVVERIAALALPLREDLTARKEAGGIEEWSSQRVSVWANRPWNNEGKQLALVHYASVEITATFTDFAALSWWVSDIAEREGVQIDTVTWSLTPGTAKSTETFTAEQAVTVAVDRATAYAGAIGLSTVTPLEIADLGLLQRNEAAPSPAPKMMRAMAMGAMDAGGGPAVEFQPEDITVTAAVEARFAAR